MKDYRKGIRNKIMEYMYKNSSAPKEYNFNKSRFKNFFVKCSINIRESISKEVPYQGNAMTYLSQIAKTYWQSLACDLCGKTNCTNQSHNVSKLWVYCKHGNHWLHCSCLGIKKQKNYQKIHMYVQDVNMIS